MENYICSVSMIGDFDVPAVNFCGVFFSTKFSQMHTFDLISSDDFSPWNATKD